MISIEDRLKVYNFLDNNSVFRISLYNDRKKEMLFFLNRTRKQVINFIVSVFGTDQDYDVFNSKFEKITKKQIEQILCNTRYIKNLSEITIQKSTYFELSFVDHYSKEVLTQFDLFNLTCTEIDVPLIPFSNHQNFFSAVFMEVDFFKLKRKTLDLILEFSKYSEPLNLIISCVDPDTKLVLSMTTVKEIRIVDFIETLKASDNKEILKSPYKIIFSYRSAETKFLGENI